MEQTKALNALEPFLALTKSASSPRAAADLITRATSAQNTYIFQELLNAPQIQSLRNIPEYTGYLTLLEIFSFGTYNDYITSKDVPKLESSQLLKLRQLTLLALAKDQTNLSYKNLLLALELPSTRELESLVISCIYAGLLSGTLDPYNEIVAISSVSPQRDLAPNSVPSMLEMLQAWSERCDGTLAALARQIDEVKRAALARWEDEREWEKQVEVVMRDDDDEKRKGNGVVGQGQGGGQRLGGGKRMQRAGEEMDVDDDEEGGAKNKKRVTGLGSA